MFIKNFLYKIKQDLLSITYYPQYDLRKHTNIDYNLYWKEKRNGISRSILSSWQKQRASYILKMIEDGSSVLDIGCGDGAVLKYLGEKKQIKGVGVDISREALEKAKNAGVSVIQMDISHLENIKNLPEVDYILGLEIIEHMPNTEEFISYIKTKARKAMIFSFPNSGYYTYRLRLLFGKFPLQWITHPGEHLRFWTVQDTKWWVSAIGMKLEKIIIYEGVPILNKIFPTIFGQGIIVKIKIKHK